jgi:hypothetical protein
MDGFVLAERPNEIAGRGKLAGGVVGLEKKVLVKEEMEHA